MARLALWQPLAGDPGDLAERLAAEPPSWLPGDTEPRGPGHWAVDIAAGPIERTVTCMVGEPRGGSGTVRRRIAWTADPEPGDELNRALPSFDGDLELRDVDGHAEIHLDGVWSTPEGTIAAQFTPAQLQQLAEAAAADFLHGVAGRILREDS